MPSIRTYLPALALSLFIMVETNAQKPNLFIGTYTSNGSAGIYLAHFNEASGSIKLLDSIPADNPSYLAIRNKGEFIYAVQENGGENGGSVVSWKRLANGNYIKTTKDPLFTGGDHPCYIAVNDAGTHATVANYSGGSVSVFPIAEDGSLQQRSQLVQHRGKGADQERQEKPHVHTTVFSQHAPNILYVTDLGTDAIIAYPFDSKKEAAIQTGLGAKLRSEPGAGPRHLTFHPIEKWMYVLEELSGKVSAYKVNEHQFEHIQTLASDSVSKKPGSADIHVHPNGRFLYASNRADANSITVFAINETDGSLRPVQVISSGGKMPRNFTIHTSGKWLLTANQEGNSIIVFSIDAQTGKLTQTPHSLRISKPVCVKWG